MYGTEADAARYATAFERRDSDEIGRHAPLGALPLRFVHALRGRRRERAG